MPRIPTYQQQISPNASGGPRTQRGGAPIADAVQSLGNEIRQAGAGLDRMEQQQFQIEQDRAQRAARLYAADASNKADTAMAEYLEELKKHAQPGAAGFAKDFLARFDIYKDAVLKNAPSNLARDQLAVDLAASRETFGRAAMGFQAQESVRYQGEIIDKGLDSSAKLIEQYPALYEREMGKWLSTIDTLDVPPEARAALRDKVRGKLAWQSVKGEIARDPEKFITTTDRGQAWRLLTTEEQTKAVMYADSEARSLVAARVSQAEQARKQADRLEKEVNEHFSKEGDKLLTAGKLSPAWIEKNRANMSASDYRYFHRALRSGEESAPTNPVVYSDLRERAGSGEDVRSEARQALTQSRIKISDYEKIVNAVESNNAVGTSWYKRGTSYIRDTLKPSDMNYDPAAAQRMASAMDDWTAWAANNKAATDDEAQNEYKRLTAEYGLIDFQNMVLTKRKPSFLVGGRQAPDLDATEDATVEAFTAGAMTEAEFNRQSQLIQEWREAMEAQLKFAKPAAKK